MITMRINYQGTSNSSANVTSTSSQIIKRVTGELERTQIIISNTSDEAVITIAKGENPATANEGIVLLPKTTYFEATDGGYYCWQGEIQAISDENGTLAIVESFQTRG